MLKRGSVRLLTSISFTCYYTAPCRTHNVRQHDLTRSLSTVEAQNRMMKSHRTFQISLKGKLHFFLGGGVSLSSTIPMQDKNIYAFISSVRSVGRQIVALCWQFCTFNRSSGDKPLPPSEAPKTHPNNLRHSPSTCCDLHINYAIDTVTVRASTEELLFWA